MIIVNTKNYKNGRELLKLAKLVQFYESEVILSVPATDIYRISAETKLDIYAQHVDCVENEKSTGFISASDVKAAGAVGTLLNHSEHALDFSTLKKTVVECKKLKLEVVICAATLGEVKKFTSLKPRAIAFEVPSLIGSGKSVTLHKPAEVLKFVDLLKGTGILPLCGAGISSASDVKAAFELGCRGVLIASAIAAQKSPREFLLGLSQSQRL